MIVVRSIPNLVDLNVFLQGGIIGGKSLKSAVSPSGAPAVNEGLFKLDGKTLIFTAPASETVTFASTNATEQEPMTLQQIKTQVEAQTTGVLVRWTTDRRLILIQTVPGALGVTVTAAGTANPFLGFSTGVATDGTFYNSNGVTSPFLISVSSEFQSGSYIVTTEE